MARQKTFVLRCERFLVRHEAFVVRREPFCPSGRSTSDPPSPTNRVGEDGAPGGSTSFPLAASAIFPAPRFWLVDGRFGGCLSMKGLFHPLHPGVAIAHRCLAVLTHRIEETPISALRAIYLGGLGARLRRIAVY